LRRYEHRRKARTRQVQAASGAASAAVHLPDRPAAQLPDGYLAKLPERLAWIHGHDVLTKSRGTGS
jgi:salicylate hydroxylase